VELINTGHAEKLLDNVYISHQVAFWMTPRVATSWHAPEWVMVLKPNPEDWVKLPSYIASLEEKNGYS
jgi:hypothetical protein